MVKRFVSFFTALIFLITLFPIAFTKNAYAYTNNSYFNNLKVGLVSMSSTIVTVNLNGSYTLNGQVYPSGSVLNLGVNGTSLTLNGEIQSQVTLTPNDSSNLLTITSGSVSNKYFGSFLIKIMNGKVLPINIIDIETYLKGVVGCEMSDYFPLEALKAQSVAARNYALSRLGWEAAKGYDFDDTTGYQVYNGYNPIYTNVINAVNQTKGQVLLYNEALVETLYSAWHGGVSENSENVWGNYVPYLRSVADSYESNSWPNGNRVLTNATIQSTLVTKLYLAATDTFIKLDLNSITKFPSGRISNINIIYKNAAGTILTKSVTKDNTRTFLALPSNLYTVTYDAVSAAYTFTGKGNGHGLGMSQIGAKNRASAGQTYDQILKFYYQNVYLQNLIVKATLNNLTQSSNVLSNGKNISFNVTAGAGNGYGYLYKYVINNGTNVVYTKDYSASSALDFVPSAAGDYTVTAYVKDLYSISDYDDNKTSSFTVYNSPVLNSFTINKTDTLVGQGVSSNLNIGGGSGSYLYKYEVSKDGTIITTRDFLSDKQFNFIPSVVGNYTMTAYVKDSISTNDYDLKQSQNFTTHNPLAFVSFNKDEANVFTGDTVNFTATVSGGSNKGLTYKYVVIKDGQTIQTRDFTESNNYNYVPNNPGNYEVDVYAVDAISDNSYDVMNKMNFVVYDYAQLSSFTADKTQLIKNNSINFTANGANGTGSYLYKFVITISGVEVAAQDYSTLNKFSFTPTSEGNYNVSVYVKDILSLKAYDDTKVLTIPVYTQPAMTFTSSQSAGLIGNSVNYSISEVGGSGEAQYRFVVMKDSTQITDSGYLNSNTFAFTPSIAGNYVVFGYIKDSLSENTQEVQSSLNLAAYNPQLSGVTANGYFYEGKPLSFIASSVGISPTAFNYRYEVYSNGTLEASSNFSASNAFTYTPAGSGTYTVKVYGKDGLSTNAYDSMKQFSITVISKPLYLSILPLYFGMTNNDVISLQIALIKLGYALSTSTGYFGTLTKNSVVSFQNSKILVGDGIVGSMTYGALNDALIQKAGIKNLTF